jgi:hypothetical protein
MGLIDPRQSRFLCNEQTHHPGILPNPTSPYDRAVSVARMLTRAGIRAHRLAVAAVSIVGRAAGERLLHIRLPALRVDAAHPRRADKCGRARPVLPRGVPALLNTHSCFTSHSLHSNPRSVTGTLGFDS